MPWRKVLGGALAGAISKAVSSANQKASTPTPAPASNNRNVSSNNNTPAPKVTPASNPAPAQSINVPDLSRSFTQSGSGRVTYHDPKSNNALSQALGDYSNVGAGQTKQYNSPGGGSMENRNIGGNVYTVPTNVRKDWKPGEAYYPDIKPTMVGEQQTGQTSEGRNYDYGYQQNYRYINPNTGLSHNSQQNMREHQERLAQAGGHGNIADRFIQAGLGRFYVDPESSKTVTRDPANEDPNLNNLRYGTLGHKVAFMNANPNATDWDYIDYIGIPYQSQSEEARQNALSTPYAQRWYDDYVHNYMTAKDGDPYGFNNIELLNRLTGGKTYTDEEGNFVPEGIQLDQETRNELLRQLTGNQNAVWNDRPNYGEAQMTGPEEYAAGQAAGVQPMASDTQVQSSQAAQPTTTQVQVIDQNGNVQTGYIGSDNRTYLADGSRPPEGSVVMFDDGRAYGVVPSGTSRPDGSTIQGSQGVGGIRVQDAFPDFTPGQPTGATPETWVDVAIEDPGYTVEDWLNDMNSWQEAGFADANVTEDQLNQVRQLFGSGGSFNYSTPMADVLKAATDGEAVEVLGGGPGASSYYSPGNADFINMLSQVLGGGR